MEPFNFSRRVTVNGPDVDMIEVDGESIDSDDGEEWYLPKRLSKGLRTDELPPFVYLSCFDAASGGVSVDSPSIRIDNRQGIKVVLQLALPGNPEPDEPDPRVFLNMMKTVVEAREAHLSDVCFEKLSDYGDWLFLDYSFQGEFCLFDQALEIAEVLAEEIETETRLELGIADINDGQTYENWKLRAEAWLRPIAAAPLVDVYYEAVVYFASRGRRDLFDRREIENSWINEIVNIIEEMGVDPLSSDPVKRGDITLLRASELVEDEGQPRPFWSGSDGDSIFLDTLMFRVASCLTFRGFEPWWRELIAELSDGPVGGGGPFIFWRLFHAFRVDALIRMCDADGLNAWAKVARTFCAGQDQRLGAASIFNSSIVAFIHGRLRESTNDSSSANIAKFLAKNQLMNGSWPAVAGRGKGDLIATCTTIHALAQIDFAEWREECEKGAHWLISQQQKEGFWSADLCSDPVTTVLVLDSIDLAHGETSVTFIAGRHVEQLNVEQVEKELCKEVMSKFDTVFISYGGPDEEFATAVNTALKRKGVRTWFFPDDSVPGDKLHRMMWRGANEHDRFLLLCSSESLQRTGVLNEIERCLEREAKEGGSDILIPVALDDFVYNWTPSDPAKIDVAHQVKTRVIENLADARPGSKAFRVSIDRIVTALDKRHVPPS